MSKKKTYTRKELLQIAGGWIDACGYDIKDADKPFASRKADTDEVVLRGLKKALAAWVKGGQLAKEEDTAIYLGDLPDNVKEFMLSEGIVTEDEIEADSADEDADDLDEDELDDAEEEDEDADDEEEDDDLDEEDEEDSEDEEEDDDELDDEEEDEDDELAALERELADEEDEDEAEEEEPVSKRKNKAARASRALEDADPKTAALASEQRASSVATAPVTAANAEAAVLALCKMLEQGKVVVITALTIAEAGALNLGASTAAPAAKSSKADKEDDEPVAKAKVTRNRPKKDKGDAAADEDSPALKRKLAAVEKKAMNEMDARLLDLDDLKKREARIDYCEKKKVKLPKGAASWDDVHTRVLGGVIKDHHAARAVRLARKELAAG